MGYAQVIEASPANFWEHQIEQSMNAGRNRQTRLSRFCKGAARLVAGERDRRFAGTRGPELARGIAEMGVDGTLRQSDPLSDHFRLETVCGETKHFRAGDEFVTVEVEGLRVSLFVCYDLRFADEFWQRADDTDVYLVPANWPEARRLAWTTLLQARAIENQAFVIGCNRVGVGNGIAYSGDSRIIDPLGEVLASAAQSESILLADVTAERVAEVRDRFRFLQDRR